jgi:UPF0042 nucleotide-binding protein
MGLQQMRGRIIIITGLSGSGKSTALSALEDNGFFCIDNLPVLLLPKFLALRNQSSSEIFKLGVVMDMREKIFVHNFKDVFAQIQAQNYDLKIIFLEAADETLVKRYSETRRRHPLTEDGSLSEAIRQERSLMTPVRAAATDIIDTTDFNIHKLRDLFTQKYAQSDSDRRMSIELVSFGFKYGLPKEADIVMDVRFLPNPFYLDHLRELDGRDKRVVEYVMSSEESTQFVEQFSKLLEFVIPLYKREGKAYLVIGIGCTGGQHRSVTVVNELAARLKAIFQHILVRHRDVVAARES